MANTNLLLPFNSVYYVSAIPFLSSDDLGFTSGLSMVLYKRTVYCNQQEQLICDQCSCCTVKHTVLARLFALCTADNKCGHANYGSKAFANINISRFITLDKDTSQILMTDIQHDTLTRTILMGV